MPRSRALFICRLCSARSPRWQGQCPQCGEWNALEAAVSTPAEDRKGVVPAARSLALTGAATPAADARPGSATAGRAPRRSCGSRELDRVLGGGIVAGSVTLLGGDPGIGKSTLLLQVAAQVAADAPVLYASGEESADQIGLRAERLGLEVERHTISSERKIESWMPPLHRRGKKAAKGRNIDGDQRIASPLHHLVRGKCHAAVSSL